MIANIRYRVLAVLLIAVSGFSLACSDSGVSQVDTDKTEPIKFDAEDGVIAPDFTAKDVVTDQDITLSDYQGTVVLLTFVSYGCSESINDVVSRQLLDIKEVYDQRNDFVPVSVFCGCCPEDVLRDFAEENDLIWPWVLDTDYSVLGDYEDYLSAYDYPILVYIDQEQNIREVSGYSDQNVLADKLDQMLSENK